jgi:NADH dehydrogenase [ubiquinone] 1 alpha subcomplex assembly factor 7
VVSKATLPGKKINVHLVETSPAMRALQQAKLERSNIEIHWHNSINEITFSPSEYTMLVAHEFFDALPIHILQVRKYIQTASRPSQIDAFAIENADRLA